MSKFVQILAASYSLPNGGTYKSGSVIALTDSEYAAIPSGDIGTSVALVTGRMAGSVYLVDVLSDGYALPNGAVYDTGDVVAVSPNSYSAIPASNFGVNVELRSGIGVGAFSATVDTANPARTVPRSFLGIGMEVWDVGRYSGYTFAYTALAGLNTDGNNIPTLRVGGGSADTAWWNPNGLAKPAGISQDYTVAYTTTLAQFLTDTGMKAIIDLNMGYGDTTVTTDWATNAISHLPAGSIISFQIGNEPDNYHDLYRPSNYTVDSYITDVASYTTAANAVIGSIPLSLPSPASYYWLDPTRFAGMEAAFGAKHSVWDWHHYPTIASQNPTINTLLGTSILTLLRTNYQTLVAHADSVGKTVRISELNSVGGGGLDGVSNSHAAALWMLRTLLEVAQIGVAAVNVHGMRDATYTPIAVTSVGNHFSITATYYGMKLFAMAAQHDSRFLPVSSVGFPTTLTMYALKGADNTYRIVVVNVDASSERSVTITLPTTSPGTRYLLTGPSLAATSGITLAGQTWDGSADGNPLGAQATDTMTPSGNTYTLAVPAHSAILVMIAA